VGVVCESLMPSYPELALRYLLISENGGVGAASGWIEIHDHVW